MTTFSALVLLAIIFAWILLFGFILLFFYKASELNKNDIRWCDRHGQLVTTIDDGETCSQCKLVL